MLNIGCGDDDFGTHRVDIRPTKTTTHVCDVEKRLPFPDEFFDEVYERNLLEHLRNVGFHFEECHRVLKTGGKLTVITDNAECARFYSLGTHTGRYEEKHRDNPGDRHYCIFTENHLRNHLAYIGFKVESIEKIGTNTLGKYIDAFTGQKPRLEVVARK